MMHGYRSSDKEGQDKSDRDAKDYLLKAIRLHEKHMNGSVPPTMRSQKEMMDYMVKAMSALIKEGR